MVIMLNLGVMDEIEADALLGICMLMNERRMLSNKEEGYKYKTSTQLRMLNTVFKITKYPSSGTRINLAILLKISTRSVQIWFQNTRQVIKDEGNPQFEKERITYNKNDVNSIGSQKHGKYMSYEIPSKKLIEIYLSIHEKNANKRVN